VRFLLTFLLILSSVCSFAAESQCVAKSKDLFNDKQYSAAEGKLKQCLEQRPKDTDALISLAGVQMVLGEFKKAEETFQYALEYLNPKSPYQAYVYSRLGDIEMRNVNLKIAEANYDNALKYEPANINSLVGKGICREKSGDIQTAAVYYKKALAVDFTNIVARTRLVALEPDVLSQKEILATLKERNIIDPAAAVYSEEDKALLAKMIKAERDSAIEYLSGKYGGRIPDGFIVERDSGKIYVRKMLTLTGYNDVIAKLSDDAKTFFMNKGLQPGTIFQLRDFDSKPIFDNQGHLTDTGLAVYTKALLGTKAYLLPTEKTPAEKHKLDEVIQRYVAQGYSEISAPEYDYVLRTTRCSEETLVKQLKVKIIKGYDRQHVLLISNPKFTPPFIIPYEIVSEYRKTSREAKKAGQTPVYRSSFGIGGGNSSRLCKEDGTLMSNF